MLTPRTVQEAQTPSTHVIPMIATFYWISSSAKFDCSYDPTTRTYDHFGLVEGSLSEDIAVALAHANEFNNEPALDELDEGKWKLEMYTMYQGFKPSYVELWFKRRVDGVVAKATDEDLREWGLGPYGSLEEEEDEEAEEAEEEQGEQEGEQEGEEEEEEEVQLFDA